MIIPTHPASVDPKKLAEEFAQKDYFSFLDKPLASEKIRDERTLNSARLLIESRIREDLESGTMTPRSLFSLVGYVSRVLDFKNHKTNKGGVKAAYQAWLDGTFILPFAMSGNNDFFHSTDIGYERGGFSSYLLKNYNKKVVINDYGEEVHVPAATRKPESIMPHLLRYAEIAGYELIPPKSKRKAMQVRVHNFPLFLIFGEVLEKIIIDRFCFQAVPDDSKKIRRYFEKVFGKGTYNRVPEEGFEVVEEFTFEDMVATIQESLPSIPQTEESLIQNGSKQALKDLIQYSCSKWCYQQGDRLMAFVRVAGKAFKYAETSLLGQSPLEALKAIKDLGIDAIYQCVKEGVSTVVEAATPFVGGSLEEVPY